MSGIRTTRTSRTGEEAPRTRLEPFNPSAVSSPSTLIVMCGIVGYVGGGSSGRDALEVVLGGLKRLEYRGYDSAGVALVADGELSVRRKAGKLGNLVALLGEEPLPAGSTAMGSPK